MCYSAGLLSGYLVIQLSGYPVILISGYLVIWLSGYLDIWLSGYLDIWLFGYLVDLNSGSFTNAFILISVVSASFFIGSFLLPEPKSIVRRQ